MDVIKALDMQDAPRGIQSSFRSDFYATDMDAYEYTFTRKDRMPQYRLNGESVDIVEFCRTNRFSAGELAKIRSLSVGDSLHFGGQGCMELTRIA